MRWLTFSKKQKILTSMRYALSYHDQLIIQD